MTCDFKQQAAIKGRGIRLESFIQLFEFFIVVDIFVLIDNFSRPIICVIISDDIAARIVYGPSMAYFKNNLVDQLGDAVR